MKNNRIIIISVVVIIMASAGLAVYAINQNQVPTPVMEVADSSKIPTSTDTSNESDTYRKYSALKGEEYDRAFLANMIVHHESAMNMAEMSGPVAKHVEIQDLSMNIASSQGKEVNDMMNWQKQWGYPATSGHGMTGMEHASGSMEDMVMMNNELEGLVGDSFDKKYLELMIMHHQGAIDMSRPAVTNAWHQEVKDLASVIVMTQTKEIEQMRQLQIQWGYINN